MDREIKFRGYSIPEEKWLFGSLINNLWLDINKKPTVEILDNTIPYDCYQDFDNSNIAVDNDSIGQFTGLKDKNGIDIYESDVVNIDRDEGVWVAEIKWNKQACGFYMSAGKYYRDILSCAQHWVEDDANVIHLDKVEIIGNIYENPELLTIT